ncbi:MAG: pilus assembly protein CpaF [Miltoncostaeaceae bacterium]|nr:pilus assembly protein CpaF [Miltoncostaeaceae bacterium]
MSALARSGIAAGGPDRALIDHLRARVVREAAAGPAELSQAALGDLIERLLDEERRILGASQRDALVQAVVDEALGLGPLESLLRDPSVTEVMVNGPESVFVERDGRLQPADVRFADGAHLLHVIDRILSPLGRRVDEASPMVDARLPDGSRVNVVIPPLALDGAVLTVRRFGARPLTAPDLVRLDTISEPMLAMLAAAVRARRNILVSGGTGSGKTTTLAALAAFIPSAERVVTIEDAAELRLTLPHVVRLESRPPSLEGRGAVPIRALVRNALRMRPDRIVVGEVRGGEALDMLGAMTTGHEGSLSTLHASSPADALRRLQILALMGDLDLPYLAVAEQVASALDLVVHQARLADGRRRVVEVAAVSRGDQGPELQTLVRWRALERRGDSVEGVFEELPGAVPWLASAARDARLADIT